MRRWMQIVALVASLLVASAILVPEGEVVTLYTFDGEGHEHATQLWIVEHEGAVLPALGQPGDGVGSRGCTPGLGSSCCVRTTRPTRASRTRPFRSPATLRLRAVVNDAMAAKYGFAGQLFIWLADLDRSLPIRLDPRAE